MIRQQSSRAVESDDALDVSDYKAQYEQYRDSKTAQIEEGRIALRYVHGDQYTAEEVQEYKRRKQPIVTYNYIGQRIFSVVGITEKLRADPKAYPRTPQEDGGADLATMAINYVMDANEWKKLHYLITLDAAIYGFAGVELGLLQNDDGQSAEISMGKVDPEEFYFDPLSMEGDFSDALFMGVRKLMDVEVAKTKWPDKADEITGSTDNTAFADNTAKIDRFSHVSTMARELVTVYDHWHLKGGAWRCCVFTESGVILEKMDSPFVRPGPGGKEQSSPKFRMWSAFVDHQSDRYGFVRNMKSAQDEANHRRSKALHWINRRQVIMDKGAVDDVEEARNELHKPDGVIEKNPGLEFEIEPAVKEIQGNLELLQESKQELENFGPNDELGGDGKSDQSGRAIQLRQQAGIAKLGPFMLAFTAWKLDLYRTIWTMVRKSWTAEKWLRVTDDEGSAQMVAINQPEVFPQDHPLAGQPTGRITNPVSQVDVDIVLDEGPDQFTTLQGTFDVLTSLASNGAPIPPEVVIEMAPIAGSVKKKLLGMMEQRKQQPDPAAQAEMAKLQAQQQADQMRMQAEAQKMEMQAQVEAQRVQFEAAQAMQLEQLRAAQEIQIEQMRMDAEMRAEQIRADSRMEIEELKMMVQQAIAMNKIQGEIERAHIAAEASIEVAERIPEPTNGYADAE